MRRLGEVALCFIFLSAICVYGDLEGDDQMPAGVIAAMRHEMHDMYAPKEATQHVPHHVALAESDGAAVKEEASDKAKGTTAAQTKVEAMWIAKCSICPTACP